MDNTLATAIAAHAAAILELAQAIREHTYMMAPQEEEPEEGEPIRFYMDGTPVQ